MVLAVYVMVCTGLLSGCGETEAPTAETHEDRPPGVITLGDVDPDEPATRVRRIQPLADLLAARLGEFGIGRGRVVIARDIGDMARMLAEGKVDLYLDSPYPVLAASREAGSETLLLRQANDDAAYWSVFITRAESGIASLEDLRGKIVVFQEAHSTSGFLLPVITLLDQGFSMQAVARLDSKVSGDNVGCHFSGDEENTVELVVNGNAPVGVISHQDFRELPEQTRDRLVIIAKTQSVPRQLIAVRPGLDADLTSKIRKTLLELTDADRASMAAQDAPRGWEWTFAELSPSAKEILVQLESKMALLPACVAER